MPLTEAKKRANSKYISSHYARLNIQYPREYVETVKAAVKGKGETLAGFVKAAIDARIADDGKSPDHDAG